MKTLDLKGRKIKTVRKMTKKELEKEGWEPHELVTVIVLDDKTKLYPARDEEGNGPGAMFGITGDNVPVHIFPPSKE